MKISVIAVIGLFSSAAFGQTIDDGKLAELKGVCDQQILLIGESDPKDKTRHTTRQTWNPGFEDRCKTVMDIYNRSDLARVEKIREQAIREHVAKDAKKRQDDRQLDIINKAIPGPTRKQ